MEPQDRDRLVRVEERIKDLEQINKKLDRIENKIEATQADLSQLRVRFAGVAAIVSVITTSLATALHSLFK